MIEHYVASLGLKKGFRVKDYESATELDNAAGEKGKTLSLANKYLVEKVALVEGRDTFATKLNEATGFPFLVVTKTKKKTDGTVETTEEVDETEVQYVNRFRKAVMGGTFVAKGFPLTEEALEARLQDFADELGAFVADAKRAERLPGRSRLPKWILERVTVIFNNGTAHRWWEVMKSEGVPIDEMTGERARDEVALAWAIKERKDRQDAEEANRYA